MATGPKIWAQKRGLSLLSDIQISQLEADFKGQALI